MHVPYRPQHPRHFCQCMVLAWGPDFFCMLFRWPLPHFGIIVCFKTLAWNNSWLHINLVFSHFFPDVSLPGVTLYTSHSEIFSFLEACFLYNIIFDVLYFVLKLIYFVCNILRLSCVCTAPLNHTGWGRYRPNYWIIIKYKLLSYKSVEPPKGERDHNVMYT